MNTLFIDLETNGLPKFVKFNTYHDPSLKENEKYYDTSRIIEIAYIICDDKNIVLKEYSTLIQPDNFEITNTNIHGITIDDCISKGRKIRDVFKNLIDDLKSVDKIVAHNVKFDYNVLLSEYYRYNLDREYNFNFNKIKKCCTMDMGLTYMKKRSNVTKYPKLTELYKYLFDEDIVQEHRALSDVIYCMGCYYMIVGK
jgi:DNA polymerase III epsilon subunit-like protein